MGAWLKGHSGDASVRAAGVEISARYAAGGRPRRVRSASTPVVGYVLDEDGGWFTVMLEDDRRVVTIPAAQIAQREPCSRGDERTPLVLLVRPRAAEYPDC
ncbi:hypothetical protein QEZ54_24110 [Catellatospora sp. KI3]|uniref:hypothetical protein n=1 Tax=Catellatospora sp. KI3 TaxID=3041620 RepID=UPI00248316E0|nr:hypothetical protein [Catellatospora sp. KI3]MDI1464075.1 hypothetical protein [Catellatospora sp. KI3]